MTAEPTPPRQFVILADDSANWRVAGLPQLERIVFAINEWAAEAGVATAADIFVVWHPEIAPAHRRLPDCRGAGHVQWSIILDSLGDGARVLGTRLFLQRHGFGNFLAAPNSLEWQGGDIAESWPRLVDEFERACRTTNGDAQAWRFLSGADEIEMAETDFLRRSGKSQDGMVSRWINRPISRRVTKGLLRSEIEPTTWTIATSVLPLAGFMFLVRGDYPSIVLGAVVFQVFSILDGCDGEMARARYLESERGARIDDFCDMLGSVLYVVGLGLGLFRARAPVFALEGVICAVAILTNEWFLRRTKESSPTSSGLSQALYPRHRRLMEFGLLLLGEKSVWWIFQFTKRDVAILLFLVLAIAGYSQWILHLWLAVSAISLILSWKTYLRQSDAAVVRP